VIRPKVSTQLDWEGELAVITGKGGRHISEDKAMDHVVGYSILNDASIGDWQFHAQQLAAGENFVGTGALGPWSNPANAAPLRRSRVIHLSIGSK
jgi:2-keto-4-pentenoate hydratase/2-oxohepta-3-ene-1,7-dioic acid hydratase in catechol pathway